MIEILLLFFHIYKSMVVQIEASWKKLLSEEFEKPYFWEIKSFLKSEIEAGKIIYPKPAHIFNAFSHCPVNTLKVVILGQDPYHGEWQAHGLSFSVQDGVKHPPSLRNIFQEIGNEYPRFQVPESGNLLKWADQWILLLNSILTVEKSLPASHAKIGWGNFTDAVIEKISEEQEDIIFVLWGNFARSKKVLINTKKHHILESPHPSPFSAHQGFYGNDHFKQINEILREQGEEEIQW